MSTYLGCRAILHAHFIPWYLSDMITSSWTYQLLCIHQRPGFCQFSSLYTRNVSFSCCYCCCCGFFYDLPFCCVVLSRRTDIVCRPYNDHQQHVQSEQLSKLLCFFSLWLVYNFTNQNSSIKCLARSPWNVVWWFKELLQMLSNVQ